MSSLSVSVLTPPGRGAVATILLDGYGAFELLTRFFRLPSGAVPAPGTFSSARPLFGFLLLDSVSREGCVVRYVSDERIELHVHGGPCVSQMIVRLFTGAGAVERVWSDSRFYSGSVTDQVLRLLPEAKTEKTAAILLHQCDGRLDRLLSRVEEKRLRGENIADDLRLIAAARRLGKYLTKPFHVLLLGPANAGKSSLINAILGFDRAVVDSLPGTTRDMVTGETAIDGWPVRFTDTAGLRITSNEIESQGIAKALSVLKGADLILTVFDVTNREERPLELFRQLVANLTSEEKEFVNCLTVLNKCDLPQASWNPCWTASTEETYQFVSAKTGAGLDALFSAMTAQLLSDGETFEAIPLDLP